jgi:hypothetical protein
MIPKAITGPMSNVLLSTVSTPIMMIMTDEQSYQGHAHDRQEDVAEPQSAAVAPTATISASARTPSAGDILLTRAKQRGAVAFVTDGRARRARRRGARLPRLLPRDHRYDPTGRPTRTELRLEGFDCEGRGYHLQCPVPRPHPLQAT